jgi:hypothetical protein
VSNSANCAPNSGSSFFQCGTVCPSGYAATNLGFSSSCGGSCCVSNSATCQAV